MEEPYKRIISLYDRTAAEWTAARGRDPKLERRWLDRFGEIVPAGGSILDIGCGSGEPVARYLLERNYAVTGVDSSPALIAIARAAMPSAEWIMTDMRALNLGRRFDGVLAWHSFFHLTPDDQRAMFARFAVHAQAGAPLMFTSGPQAGEIVGEWCGEPLYSASLAPDEYRELLTDTGFGLLHFAPNDEAAGGATVWLAQRH